MAVTVYMLYDPKACGQDAIALDSGGELGRGVRAFVDYAQARRVRNLYYKGAYIKEVQLVGMDATELAHWRYRVKALETDISVTEYEYRHFREVEPDHLLAEDAEAQLNFERYLLEEAEYMCELGELTLQ